MSKKLSEKNTKTELVEGYNKAVEEIEALKSVKIDPIAEVTQKKTEAVVSRVENITPSKTIQTISELEETFKKALSDLEAYTELKHGIEIKKAELKEIFDIEVNANSLAALINANSDAKIKFESELVSKQAELEAYVAERRNNMKTVEEAFIADTSKARKEFDANLNAAKEIEKEKMKKEATEYEYEFKRKQKIELDKLHDQLNYERKQFEAEQEAENSELESRIKVVSSREAFLDQIETALAESTEQIKNFPEVLSDAVEAARLKGEAHAASNFKFQSDCLKKDFEGKLALAENKIANLTDALASEKLRSQTAEEKRDEAYKKIEDMAAKTVEGASRSNLVESLQDSLNSLRSQNSK